MSRIPRPRVYRLATVAVGALLVMFLAAPALPSVEAASPSGAHAAVERHCIARAGRTDSPAKGVPVAICFPSFAKAIDAATAGATRLPATFKATDLTRGHLRPSVQTVISIDFVDANYQGNTLTWYVDNDYGCAGGSQYVANSMPAGWNDVVSSARVYDSCSVVTHFEHINLRGAWLDCYAGTSNNCSTMGAMNDATSSETWQ